jgi:hypothetical protein
MKTLLLKWGCLLIALSACFISCNKNNDNKEEDVNLIVGTWRAVFDNIYEQDKETAVISNQVRGDYTEPVYYIFKRDGVLEYKRGDGSVSIRSWVMEGMKLFVTIPPYVGSVEYDVLQLDETNWVFLLKSDRTTYWRYIETTCIRE